jgi:hypothetical protein
MFGFETQSEIVGWQKSGTTGNWWTTMDWNLDQLCFISIYIFEPERIKVDYAKLTWISWYITSV